MKKFFKGILTIIFLVSSLNICHAQNVNANKKYINKNISVENKLYSSIKVENNLYNSSAQYYGQASSLQQLEPLLKEAMENRENSIVIRYTGVDCYYDYTNINLDKIQNVIEKILDNDHYLKYSLRGYQVGASGYYEDIDITFNFNYLTTKYQEEYVDRRVESILSEIITNDMNDYAKEKVIHDYIVANVQYDTSLQEHSAYAALAKGKTVCQGYSLLMFKMLQKVGIKSIIVESEPMNHAWNMVYIDNKWYHVDATWNDPVPDVPNRVLYDYYNLTDDEISQSIRGNRHIWNVDQYPSAIYPYDPSFVTIGTNKDDAVNVELSVSNNIIFNIRLNKNVNMEKIEMFDGDKFLQSTNNVNGNTVFMTYNGKLEEKPYKLKVTVEDGRSCFTNVNIQSTLEVVEVDNKNKLVKVKALMDGQLSINGNILREVKQGEIITIDKEETVSIIPFIAQEGISYNSINVK